MKTNRLFTALAMAGAAGAAMAAPPIEFSGYFRAGVGVNTAGGNQVCFGLANADTKFRLGNECDYVVEPTFDAKLAEFEGADWHVRVMPSVYKAWDSGTGAGNGPDTLTTRFGQIYGYGNNIKQLGNGRVWAGRRFYNRLQTGINDQFLENNDGNGAGVEDMDLGIGKLSIAFMMDPNNDAYNNRMSLPIRMTGIKTVPNGELSIYVTPSKQLKTEDQTATPPAEPADQPNGLAVGVYQKLSGTILGGDTLIGVKADKFGELKNTRVVFQQGMSVGATAVDFITEYRIRKNTGNTGNKWFMIGARADTHLSGPFRFLAEVGHDQVKPDGGGAKQNLTKGTLAVAASAGKDAGSRPTIRLFVTHAIWNDAVRTAGAGGLSSTNARQVFGDKKSGTSVGVQAESWW
jgi:maltoporin